MGETVKNWRDTISFAGGVNFTVNTQIIGCDISYTPTPIPLQTGRYNYVDNDRLSRSDSYKLDFGKVSLKLSAQIHYLIEMENKKSINGGIIDEFPDSIDIKTGNDIESSYGFQSNNLGYPGFSSSGWIGVFSILLLLES